MPKSSNRTVPYLLSCLALCAFVGCGGGAEPDAPPPPSGERVENAELGIALASLPTTFTLDSNEGSTLALTPDGERPGALHFETGYGVNLVDEVKKHKESVLAQPDGDYRGQIELGTQLGTAYASRGRYTGDTGSATEEFRIFVLHPSGEGNLTIVYSYPAGEDTAERRDELLLLLGEVEGLV